jgi:hypothetical protein
VEAFVPGAGWRTFDPTPPDPTPATLTLGMRIALYMDAADTFWQEWVLNYNLDRQLLLAYRMEESSRRLSLPRLDRFVARAKRASAAAGAWLVAGVWRLTAGAALILFLASAGPPLWRWLRVRQRVFRVRRGQAQAGDATLLYERMLRLLRARGFEKPSWLTPNEFVRILPPSEISALAIELTTAYNDLRFGGRLEAAARMMRVLERLERA